MTLQHLSEETAMWKSMIPCIDRFFVDHKFRHSFEYRLPTTHCHIPYAASRGLDLWQHFRQLTRLA